MTRIRPVTSLRGRRIDPFAGSAVDILRDAVWYIDATEPSASAQTVANLGWGGSALDAVAGSGTGADAGDPKFLDWTGTNYVWLSGVAGNYLSVPDEAALGITGDLDIRVRVALDDWTPTALGYLLSKIGSSGNRSYGLILNTNGFLTLRWYADGISLISQDSTAAVPGVDGAPLWIRATLDVDNGSSQYDVKFYTSADGSTWTQLGATKTGSTGTTSIYAGTASLAIGSDSSGTNAVAGKVYRAIVKSGIDGTTVLDIDTSVVQSGSATSFTARTGQTVTIARSTTGKKSTSIVRPLWLVGTDDVFTQAGALTDSLAWAVGSRVWTGSTPAVAVDFTETTIKRLLGQDGSNYLNREIAFAAAWKRTLSAAEKATLSTYLTSRLP